jgi:hypothetical protein
MAKKKKKSDDGGIRMDSFLDILTCLVGVLVLIIILTSIDASQTKVLIPTPMAGKSDKRMLFVECRNDELFRIDLNEIKSITEEKLAELDQTLTGDEADMKRTLQELTLEVGDYNVDPAYVLVGSIALTPRPGSEGDDLSGVNMQELAGIVVPGWYGDLLDQADPDEDIITFLVRDDSFRVFKKARAIAWNRKIKVAYELLAVNDPIIFGLGGDISLAQ